MKLEIKQDVPSIPVIENGRIQTEAFRGKTIDEAKIRDLTFKQGYSDLSEIVYAEYNEATEELLIIKKL